MNLRLWIVGVVGFLLAVTAPFMGSRDQTTPGSRYDVTMGTTGQAPDTLPSIERLMEIVSVLAHDSMAGREAGSEQNAAAARWLADALGTAGIPPAGDDYLAPFTWEGGEGTNVLARIDGTLGTSLIVLSAHFDHVGVQQGRIYNGADDNASGTAAVLEIARLLIADPPRSDVLIALLDAEESGLQGARALVAAPPMPFPPATLNINLDMVSRSDGLLWAAGSYHTPALRPILERVAERAPTRVRLGHDRPGAPEGDDWTNSSDHGPFHDAGLPFVYFGVEDHADYHSPTDDVERIVPAEFEAAVLTIYSAVRALDAALPLTDPLP